MATILMTWELGGAMGHLLRMRPIGQELLRRGHRVILALHDMSRVAEFFSDTGMTFVQAPRISPKRQDRIAGFADILSGVGFSDEQTLEANFAAWNQLFDEIKPDLVITDYSPFALLALRGRSERKAIMGIGFYWPPDGRPLPHWAIGDAPLPFGQLVRDEQALADQVNRLLEKHQRPPIERLSQLFHHVDESILATYKELDPYVRQSPVRYWGHWQPHVGIAPPWPNVRGPKIYAYLKAFSGLEELLRQLKAVEAPTVILASGIDPALRDRYAGSMIQFETRPLDIKLITDQCDLAITNAGHGTIASMLLAGKPCLLIPLYIEQLLNSQAVAKLGAGRWVLPTAHSQLGPALRDALINPVYQAGAQVFAHKHQGFVPGQQVGEVADRFEQLLVQGS